MTKPSERTHYRSKIASELAKSDEFSQVQVLRREAISQFGIDEWRLIEQLEENGEVIVGVGDMYSAAVNLQELMLVEIEELEENEEYEVVRTGGTVVVPVFETKK